MFPLVSYHRWYARSLKSQKLCFCSAVKNKEMIGLMVSLLCFLVATMWLTHLTFDLGIQHFISLWSSCPLSQCVSLLPPLFFGQCICSHSLSLTLTSQTHTHTLNIIDHCVTQYKECKYLSLNRDNQLNIHLLPSHHKGMLSDYVM